MRKKELKTGEKEKCLYDKKNKEKVYSYIKKHRRASINDVVEDCAVSFNISREEVWCIVQSMLEMRMAERDKQILAKASKAEKEILSMAEKGKITVVDFYATRCSPCKALSEVLHKIESPEIVVKKVDVENDNGLSKRLGISGVPFVAIIDKSGKAFTAFSGHRGEEYLKEII